MAKKEKLPSIFFEIPVGETQISVEIPPEVHWDFSLPRIPWQVGRKSRCVQIDCVCNIGCMHTLLSKDCLGLHVVSTTWAPEDIALQMFKRWWRSRSPCSALLSLLDAWTQQQLGPEVVAIFKDHHVEGEVWKVVKKDRPKPSLWKTAPQLSMSKKLMGMARV